MSGHSKWSKVKHQKAVTDVVRGKIFTKAAQAISIAVKEGGGVTDPQSNFKLRLAIDNAKANNVPKENIDRAILKAKSGNENVLQEKLYEVYCSNGIALLIEAVTDNNNRTFSNLKNFLERNNCSIVTPGSVAYLFKKYGRINIISELDFNELLEIVLESGAVDIKDYGKGEYGIITEPEKLSSVRDKLERDIKIKIENYEIFYMATVQIEVDRDLFDKFSNIFDEILDLDDIHNIYTNLKN